jgi:hypothetical protein
MLVLPELLGRTSVSPSSLRGLTGFLIEAVRGDLTTGGVSANN